MVLWITIACMHVMCYEYDDDIMSIILYVSSNNCNSIVTAITYRNCYIYIGKSRYSHILEPIIEAAKEVKATTSSYNRSSSTQQQ